MRKHLTILTVLLIGLSVHGQYSLVWEDNFDGTTLDSSKWGYVDEVGVWNTGANNELQRYRKENVTVGNDGAGNNCLIITAKKESYDGYQFTSGRIDTRAKFSFKYGKLVTRVKVPNLANGLWPAFWTLGVTPNGWPACGEIDILEMGHAQGITNNTQNKFLTGALHWESSDKQADYPKAFTASENLNEDYHLFTLEWTPSYIKMYLDSIATPFFVMNMPSADGEEFTDYLHYVIFNLAVGGQLPGITTAAGITATLPASMYVDWVKLYQKDGEGAVNINNEAVWNNFGVFDEAGSYFYKADLGFDAKIEINSAFGKPSNYEVFEGDTALAYSLGGNDSLSVSVNSLVNRNLSLFTKGSICFYLKTNNSQPLTIAVNDFDGGRSSYTLSDIEADNTYHKVVVPVKDLTGNVNLSKIKGLFTFSAKYSSAAEICIDKVFWLTTVPSTGNYLGLYTENPNISEKLDVNNSTIFLYIWENTLNAITTNAYEGKNVLSFASAAGKTWYGVGLCAKPTVDLSAYKNGTLYFALKTSDTKEFYIGIEGANKTKKTIIFNEANDPYEFKRDGQWHQITIPMSEFSSVDLTACGNFFIMGGAPAITDLAVDDVYLSSDTSSIENPGTNTSVRNVQRQMNDVIVSPNPFHDVVNIKTSRPIDIIELYTCDGKIAKSIKSNGYNANINLSGLQSGLYFLVVNKERQSTRKLTKY